MALDIQSSRRPSTLESYKKHWQVFANWGKSLPQDNLSIDPFKILDFLQQDFRKGLASSTLNSQWAAIKAFGHFKTVLEAISPLVKQLLKCFRFQSFKVHPPLPSWDLSHCA